MLSLLDYDKALAFVGFMKGELNRHLKIEIHGLPKGICKKNIQLWKRIKIKGY